MAVERPDTPDNTAPRANASRHGRFLTSFVERNPLWARYGLGISLLLAVVIVALALMPVAGPVQGPPGLDKLYRFVAFMVLVFPVIVTDTNRWSWVVPAALVFGGAIEVTQPLLGRSADWLDFGASVSGVLAGAALAEILHNHIRRSVLGDVPDERTDRPLMSEHDRLEAMRSDLMAELRTVLREELEAAAQREAAAKALSASAINTLAPQALALPSSTQPPPPQPNSEPPETSHISEPVIPVRVPPVRLQESPELRRARIALRAKEHPYDPLTDARGAVLPKDRTQAVPTPQPRNTPPGGGAAPRH